MQASFKLKFLFYDYQLAPLSEWNHVKVVILFVLLSKRGIEEKRVFFNASRYYLSG